MKKKFNYIKRFTSSIALLTLFFIPKAEAHIDPETFNFKMIK